MVTRNLLSPDEIEALLHGVRNGNIDTSDEYCLRDGVARPVDLTAHERIVRGRMPTLAMINSRFCRNFRVSLFDLLHRAVEVSFQGVRLMKFAEHMQAMAQPTSLNTIRMPPLRGNGLFVLDKKLVFSLVEAYFGGEGRFAAQIEGRDFTAVENRIIQLTMERCCADMRDAWLPVMPIDLEHEGSESNPLFASIAGPADVVVVATFAVGHDDIGGELHLTLPYSMLEPIRDLLDARVQSDRDLPDDRWTASIRAEMEFAEVDLHATLLRAQLSLSRLLQLKPGDILPIELPADVTLCAEGVPLFRGQFGVANGNNAIKITSTIKESKR